MYRLSNADMNKTKISAEIIADSKNEFGNRLTTMVVTFPRIILAEMNTHRMFSRNSASSRAIPFKKMVRSVMENPFIPIAWQKDHKGMQGTEYLDSDKKYKLSEFVDALAALFDKEDDKDMLLLYKKVLVEQYNNVELSLVEWWLIARNKVVEAAVILSLFGTTKQLCNRLLEPFMWHTVIVTASEWENFFALRCPHYQMEDGETYRSRKEVTNEYCGDGAVLTEEFNNYSEIEWLQLNKGQAEIHMMALAEAMWDAYKQSTPKVLEAGEWHLPFGDNIDYTRLGEATSNYYKENPNEEIDINKWLLKIATARCARVSYTVVGEEGKPDNYEADFMLHDRLTASGHWSPAEHCAKAMTTNEFQNNKHVFGDNEDWTGEEWGWSGNLRGFLQYRKMFKNENIK